MAQEVLSATGVGDSAEQLVNRIGQLTRQMREGMRELGLDKGIARAAEAIPNARDRLNYVAQMTERAAERALNAIDVAQPIQEDLSRQANGLTQRWDVWFSSPLELDDARELVINTRAYLSAVPQQVSATNAQLMEIMMAQDFQDLTGQIIRRVITLVQDLELSLVDLIRLSGPVVMANSESGPKAGKVVELAGPIVPGVDHGDSVQGQDEVDSLLSSLGF